MRSHALYREKREGVSETTFHVGGARRVVPAGAINMSGKKEKISATTPYMGGKKILVSANTYRMNEKKEGV